jgi:hypothetical protein
MVRADERSIHSGYRKIRDWLTDLRESPRSVCRVRTLGEANREKNRVVTASPQHPNSKASQRTQQPAPPLLAAVFDDRPTNARHNCAKKNEKANPPDLERED